MREFIDSVLEDVGNNTQRRGGESVFTISNFFYFTIRFIYATLVKGTCMHATILKATSVYPVNL